MTPLLRLLRWCDSDVKPALGYVYEGMFRARKGIKDLFKNKKDLYQPCTKIISERWDKIKGNFGRISAVQGRTKHCPDEWWRMFGGDCPILQNFAIRILSQTASSSDCERNWSVFERIHTKRRNRLEHQRLNDLVYVHYNLRLQHRLHLDKRSYDPVDYECIDETDFWVVEEEAQGELDYDQLKNMLEQKPPSQTQGLVDEDDDDSEFHLLSDHELDAYNTPMSQ
nr:hypothetical protein [Tanacetum cinerariifolium]